MGRQCTVCIHPQITAIDEALIAGDSFASISAKYSLSPDAVKRHARNGHINKGAVQASTAAQLALLKTGAEKLALCEQRMDMLFIKAEQANSLQAMLAINKEIRELVKLQMQVSGELNERAQVNIDARSVTVQDLSGRVFTFIKEHGLKAELLEYMGVQDDE